MAILIGNQSPLLTNYDTALAQYTMPNFTAGSTVLVFCGQYRDIYTVGCNVLGVPAVQIADTGGIFNVRNQIFMLRGDLNPGGGGLVQCTSTPNSWFEWSIMEVFGLDPTSPVDKTVARTVTVTPTPALSNPSGILSQADELVLSCVANDRTGGVWTPPTGWTMTAQNVKDWTNSCAAATAYRIVSSTASIAAQWLAATDYGACDLVTLKAAPIPPSNTFFGRV